MITLGIDAPLGWPAAFTQAATRWTATTWDDPAFQKTSGSA